MKIIYLSPSIIPSRTANSVNVMEMCGFVAKKQKGAGVVKVNIKAIKIKLDFKNNRTII